MKKAEEVKQEAQTLYEAPPPPIPFFQENSADAPPPPPLPKVLKAKKLQLAPNTSSTASDLQETIQLKAELVSAGQMDFKPRATHGVVGLSNQGATCFLNSLLQSLFHTPEFRKIVYQFVQKLLDPPLELLEMFLVDSNFRNCFQV